MMAGRLAGLHPAGLHPAYFAMVMATGIVSIASHLLGLRPVAVGLFGVNIVFYAVLWTLTAVRIARYRARVVDDLMHHGRSVGFFTTIPATCVLGTQFLLVGGMWEAAAVLWLFGTLLWAAVTFGLFTLLTVKQDKPALVEGLNGGWLVAVVAAQSVCVLGAPLVPSLGAGEEPALLFCLAMWLGGGMLYFWIISLIFYRYTFFPLSPADLAPPYWVNMGAVAISTLAGTALIAAAPQSSLLTELLPFLKGMTLLYWSTATWWIPMLFLLGVWRHLYRRFPLRYDPLYWGAVFPLGMYTACTARLAQSLEAPYLMTLARLFLPIALLAWTLAMVGLVSELVKGLRSGRPDAASGERAVSL